jgi:hypothetical protein
VEINHQQIVLETACKNGAIGTGRVAEILIPMPSILLKYFNPQLIY